MEASEKSLNVQKMFSSIAPRYDFLNKLLSAGRDKYWRRVAVGELSLEKGGTFLDVATGTADVALSIIENANHSSLQVMGVDFSEKMLELGRTKVHNAGLDDKIELKQGDATALPFGDNIYQGAITAFGLRNFSMLKAALKEMLRVIVPGGKIVILEFTNPENPILRRLYYMYFRNILPIIGGMVSGNRSAYQYLPDSVIDFPTSQKLKNIMEECGIKNVRYRYLTCGIVALHVGEKGNTNPQME